jgi:hypothetical protein
VGFEPTASTSRTWRSSQAEPQPVYQRSGEVRPPLDRKQPLILRFSAWSSCPVMSSPKNSLGPMIVRLNLRRTRGVEFLGGGAGMPGSDGTLPTRVSRYLYLTLISGLPTKGGLQSGFILVRKRGLQDLPAGSVQLFQDLVAVRCRPP